MQRDLLHVEGGSRAMHGVHAGTAASRQGRLQLPGCRVLIPDAADVAATEARPPSPPGGCASSLRLATSLPLAIVTLMNVIASSELVQNSRIGIKLPIFPRKAILLLCWWHMPQPQISTLHESPYHVLRYWLCRHCWQIDGRHTRFCSQATSAPLSCHRNGIGLWAIVQEPGRPLHPSKSC